MPISPRNFGLFSGRIGANYGAWQDQQTQNASANNTGVAMIFRTTDVTPVGISILNDPNNNPTKITFQNKGVFNLQFSSQFINNDTSGEHYVNVWLRKNGLTTSFDVSGSAGYVGIPKKNAGINGNVIASWNYLLDVNVNDFFQLVWSTDAFDHVSMFYYVAGNPPPAAASVILTITSVF